MKNRKWELRIFLLSLLVNAFFTLSYFKRRVDFNSNGIMDVCLAQGNTKVQCDAIERLIERSKRQNLQHGLQQQDNELRPVRI